MATVNKNFRIKNGLIVEGTTGTIDGYNILTESQASQDFIVNTIGGTATDQNTPNTVVKRDGSGNFSAGSISLNNLQVQNAGNIYEDGAFIIEANNGYGVSIIGKQNVDIQSTTGSVNITNVSGAYVNEDEIVTRTAEQTLSNKELVDPFIRGQIKLEDSTNTYEAFISLASDELLIDTDSRNIVLSPEGGNLYLQNSSSPDNILATQGDLSSHNNATSNVHGVSGDVVGTSDQQSLSNKTFTGNTYFQSAGGAGGNNNYITVDSATGKLTVQSGYNLDLAASGDVVVSSNNGNIILSPDGMAYLFGASAGNEIATRGHVDYLIGDSSVNGSTGNTIKDRIDSAIAGLVDSAPALLDTLNELAAAIADNPNYATDMATSLSTKQDNLTAGDGISLNGATISIDQTYTATRTYAETLAGDAESNSNSYTDQQISNGNVNAEPMYKGVKLGYYTELISGWDAVGNGATFSPVSWNSSYGTAKLTVHVRDGVHSQASEVLIARDSSNNIAITEYAIVSTNGIIADVSASYANNQIYLNVIPVNGHTSVEAVATGSVIVWAD